MKKSFKIVTGLLTGVLLGGIFMGSFAGCGKTEKQKKLVLPEEEAFIQTTVWNDAMMTAYLKPYWYSREIYNETAMFVGEEGEATLMYTPDEVESVRNYNLNRTYTEGVDYVIEGNKIKRLKGSAIPYWEPEDYFLAAPNNPSAVIGVDKKKMEFNLEGDRFLYYGELASITSKQVAVTYRHSELFDGEVPKEQSNKLTSFLEKLNNGEEVNIMVYGDSVATGCNASGTVWGGNVAPFMPDAYNIVKQYLEKQYHANVKMENTAVGGWRLTDCISGYNSKIAGKNIDLMILRIGGNDGYNNETGYVDEMNYLLNMFFSDYPDACVILQTPELPNEQSTWTLNVPQVSHWTELAVAQDDHADQIAIADVQKFAKWLQGRNKRTRDFLANNINHGNDFIIRVYAQYILKTMFGDDFVEEIYE